jgi:SET domain
MPKIFKFYDMQNDIRNLLVEKILNASRCEGITKNGSRCKRKCIIGFEYCPAHMKNELNLKTGNSNIQNAGKGLFVIANKDDTEEMKHGEQPIFRKDDKICEYNGDRLTLEELNEQYGNYTAPYAVALTKNEVIDAGGKRGVGSLINSGRNSYPNNCKFSVDTRGKKVNVKATRNIYDGNELFIPYGNAYHFNEPVEFETKNYYPPRRNNRRR